MIWSFCSQSPELPLNLVSISFHFDEVKLRRKFSAIMEGAVTYLKMRDRKLTEKFLSLAVKDTFVPVLQDYFYQVYPTCLMHRGGFI